jgi:SulP family sulfate permease
MSTPTNGRYKNDHEQGRLIITPNGVTVDPSERTPLLGKDPAFETDHPDWIRGQQDLERQEVRRRMSWPKLHNVILWPKEKGLNIARTIINPKSWNRNAIVQKAVKEPLGYLPAVILGLLLNILDALSYGTSSLIRHPKLGSILEFGNTHMLLLPFLFKAASSCRDFILIVNL